MTTYDRDVLIDVLTHHVEEVAEHNAGHSCPCGDAYNVPYPDHVADVYERWVAIKRSEALDRERLDYSWANRTVGGADDPLPS